MHWGWAAATSVWKEDDCCYCCHTKRSIGKISEVILLQPGGIILWAVDVSLQEVLCLGTFYFVDGAHGRCVVCGQICDSGPVVLCLYWASASSRYSSSPPWVAPRTSARCGSGWWSHLIRLPLNLVLKRLLQVFFRTHFFPPVASASIQSSWCHVLLPLIAGAAVGSMTKCTLCISALFVDLLASDIPKTPK